MITDCVACDYDDCLATFLVSVPTTAALTRDEEMQVGADCVADAIRALEASEFAAGPAQVDPLSYLDGAA